MGKKNKDVPEVEVNAEKLAKLIAKNVAEFEDAGLTDATDMIGKVRGVTVEIRLTREPEWVIGKFPRIVREKKG